MEGVSIEKICVGAFQNQDGRTDKNYQSWGKRAEKIGYVIMTIKNNSAGGQPVSMQNINEKKALANKYGLKMIIDAARFAENAFFLLKNESQAMEIKQF